MLLWELATIVNSPAPLHALHVGTEQGIHQRDEALASQRQERGGCCCATALHADPSACCSSACAILPLPHPCSSCSVQLLLFQLGSKRKHRRGKSGTAPGAGREGFLFLKHPVLHGPDSLEQGWRVSCGPWACREHTPGCPSALWVPQTLGHSLPLCPRSPLLPDPELGSVSAGTQRAHEPGQKSTTPCPCLQDTVRDAGSCEWHLGSE